VGSKKTTLGGRYRLLGSAAHGPSDTVWRAKDELLDRFVTVRQLSGCPFDAAHSDRVRAKVIRDARAAIRLRHPNAIVLHDVFELDGTPYVVTEHLAARTLSEVVGQYGSLPPGRVAALGARLASALAAAHADGILHRDISPDNVLITEDGSVKLTGFGLSTGDSPAYLAPETARGATPDFPADVFSLGATLYAALEGHPPSGTVPPRTHGPVLDAVLGFLHPAPAARPTMARAEQVLTGLAASRPGAVDRVVAPRSHVRVVVAGTVLVLVIGAVVLSRSAKSA
jgi:serine/threonine protein kinase